MNYFITANSQIFIARKTSEINLIEKRASAGDGNKNADLVARNIANAGRRSKSNAISAKRRECRARMERRRIPDVPSIARLKNNACP